MLVYFSNQAYMDEEGNRKIHPKKFYSNLRHDKKGEEYTIEKLKALMQKSKYKGTWEFICFYSNHDEKELDRLTP